jgi:predicted amidohydrolase
MKLALVQINGDTVYRYEDTASRIKTMIEKACAEKPDFIVLPECAYPSYLIRPEDGIMEKSLAGSEALLKAVSELARRHSVYICIGIAARRGGKLYNAAVTFDREGKEIDFTAKTNLWHFDDRWFAPGPGYSAFDTEFGRIGSMICADGRIPEIAGLLARDGAKLIIDPVNLVAAAEKPEQLSNQQYEFILQERARENGVYIAVCDKCGVEGNVVTFLGRSFVTDPEGAMIAQCPPDREEIKIVDIDLSRSKPVSRREKALFEAMARPVEDLPVSEICRQPFKVEDLVVYTMLARFKSSSAKEYLEKARYYVKNAWILRARLLVLPEAPQSFVLDESVLKTLSGELVQGYFAVLAGTIAGGARKAFVIANGEPAHEIDSVGLANSPNASSVKIAQLGSSIRLGAMFDEEIHIPEIARTAMLRGADVMVYFDSSNGDSSLKAIKTRAAENKVFVARSASAAGEDCSSITNPDGARVTTTLRAEEHSTAAYINTALSKFKSVVPGTDIVKGRFPELYGRLFSS